MALFEEPSFLIQMGKNTEEYKDKRVNLDYLPGGIEYNDFCDGVILSPLYYNRRECREISNSVNSEEQILLFDPGFYQPNSEKGALNSHPYWRQTEGTEVFGENNRIVRDTQFFEDEELVDELSREIISYMDEVLETDAYIAPASYLDVFNEKNLDQWQALAKSFKTVARENRDIPVYGSLPTNGANLAYNAENLYDWITTVDFDGFYIVVDFDDYPLKDTEQLVGLLELVRILKDNKYEVLVGYTHQIAHLLFAVGADAFSSGMQQYLRNFDIDRWRDSAQDTSGGSYVVKYYTNKLLNELKVKTTGQFSELDELNNSDFDIGDLRENDSIFDGPLFDRDVQNPSDVDWGREDSYYHYLSSCNNIAKEYRDLDVEQRYEHAETVLSEAKELVESIEEQIDSDMSQFDGLDSALYDSWESSLDEISISS